MISIPNVDYTTNISAETLRKVLVVLLWASSILFWVTAIVAHLPIVNYFSEFITPLVLTVVCFAAFSALKKKIRLSDVGLYLFCAIGFLLSYLLFPSNTEYLDKWVLLFLLQTLPYLFLGLIIDFDVDKDWLYYASLFTVFVTVAYRLFYVDSSASGDILDDMNASYSLLPHLMLVTWRMIKKVKLVNVFAFVLGFFLLVSFGTRGPVLFLFIYITLSFFLLTDMKYKVLARVLIIAIAAVFLLYFEPIMEYAESMLASRGLSTRVVNSVINRDVNEDVSMIERGIVQKTLINDIPDNIFGKGFCGTFVIVGTYAHNLAIDFLIDFGIILGGSLLFIMAILFIRSFIYVWNRDDLMFYLILFLCGFGASFLSWSYMNNYMLYMLIGYSISVIRKHNQQRRTRQ